ncbi:MAG TPA: hypothetical protein VLK33_01480 [Terriglobales bacterium]|nr:hypothetical protein [Terriglobales bacterium]
MRIVAGIAILSTLWFVRAYALNAANAGWGDADQDRHQWWLGWGVRISAALTAISIGAWVARSKQALISILSGTTVSGLLVLVAPKFTLLYSTLGLPGFFIAMYTFGVHADGGKVVSYFFIVNAIVYSAIVFVIVRNKVAKLEWPD